MKAEEWTHSVLLSAQGKTTALPREGAEFVEFLRF